MFLFLLGIGQKKLFQLGILGLIGIIVVFLDTNLFMVGLILQKHFFLWVKLMPTFASLLRPIIPPDWNFMHEFSSLKAPAVTNLLGLQPGV